MDGFFFGEKATKDRPGRLRREMAATKIQALQRGKQDRAAARELQAQAPNQTMLLHHALLVREGGLPRPLLDRLEALRRECGFGAATDGAHAEATLPGDRDHDARRKAQQLLEANYSDAQASAWRHAPLPLMQRITPFETCACESDPSR